jgi:hypothetical protein
MIDTDKYEWDSKCRLVVIDGELYQRGSNGDYHISHQLHDKAVAQIVADAPLLLAEVKRLRRAFRIATAHIGYGNHLGHNELRRALNSVGIDHNSLPWADGEWEEPLPTFGGVAHYD